MTGVHGFDFDLAPKSLLNAHNLVPAQISHRDVVHSRIATVGPYLYSHFIRLTYTTVQLSVTNDRQANRSSQQV